MKRAGAFALLAFLAPAAARADAPSLFGQGARSAGVARADVAGSSAADAPRQNAALAASPGVILRLGYGYGGIGLSFNGNPAGVADASGLDVTVQAGSQLTPKVALGAALAFHLPDRGLARLGFRPATEPQFPLYESALQRAGIDVVAALRYRALAIGAGLAASLDVGGSGARFALGQDAKGTYADAGLDVGLRYRFAPIVGVLADFGTVAIGASFRGPIGLDLQIDNRVAIALTDNPLNGTTAVRLRGTAGFDPAVVTLGARFAILRGLTALASIEYAAWHVAPPPVADVDFDVRLGTTPGLRSADFRDADLRDTLTARFGVDYHSRRRWAVRAGYALAGSPVPPQTGLTTYLGSARHQIALGGGYHFGQVLGFALALDLAAQLHLLNPYAEDKPDPSLPYAHYEAGGHIVYGAAALEAQWR